MGLLTDGPELVRRARSVYERGGLAELLRRAPPFVRRRVLRGLGAVYRTAVRPLLPATGEVTMGGVRVARRKPLDRLWDDRRWHGRPPSKADYKAGNRDCLRERVEPGDTVVVVGGGNGVTTVHAAAAVGPEGRVVAYEGSGRQVEIIEGAVRRHGVGDRVDVRHAVVADDTHVYDGMGDPDAVAPAALPDCDVLEMDCEGAEFEILRGLATTPRELIVEVHPHKFDGSPGTLLAELDDRGYEVVRRVDQRGRELTDSEFAALLAFERDGSGRVTPDGTVHPPVVAATRSG